MTLPLTAEMLAHVYDYLCCTPPFNKFNMPPSEDVLFKVARTRDKQGWYQWNGKQHTITGSQGRIGQSVTLLIFVAHEMTHLYLEQNGLESRAKSNDTHNAAFRAIAAQVCKCHGFDLKSFY